MTETTASLALTERRAAMATNTDPRALLTREKLIGAMRDVMTDPDAGLPTVAFISANAGVARSAFYSHFATVGELAAHVLEGELQALARADEAVRRDKSVPAAEATRRVVRHMVQTLLEHRPIYSWLLLSGGDGLSQRIRNVLAASTQRNMIEVGLDRDVSPARIEAAAAYAAGGFVNTMAAYFDGCIDLSIDDLTDTIVDLSPEYFRGPS